MKFEGKSRTEKSSRTYLSLGVQLYISRCTARITNANPVRRSHPVHITGRAVVYLTVHRTDHELIRCIPGGPLSLAKGGATGAHTASSLAYTRSLTVCSPRSLRRNISWKPISISTASRPYRIELNSWFDIQHYSVVLGTRRNEATQDLHTQLWNKRPHSGRICLAHVVLIAS